MHLLVGHDDTVMAWARRKNPTFLTPKYAFGILRDGTLCGAIMVIEETNHTADLGIVSDVPPGPGIARRVFRLLFDEMNYGRVEVTIRRSDTKSRKAAPKWGFKYDGTATDYWGPGVHAVRFAMLKEDCPFLRKTDGQSKNSRYGHGQRASGPERSEAAGVQRAERPDTDCLQPA